MPWKPWQEAQSATVWEPDFSASPWKLESKVVIRSEGMPKRLMRRTSPWQRPHVSGTLLEKTLDSGFFGRMIEWLVWQSVQTGAFNSPRATAFPCTPPM